jgi:predicted MFS family arabinose efflux permease
MTIDTRQRVGRATIAIAAMFAVNGAAYGSWVPRLPEIRRELGVGDTALGLTLVGVGVGGLVMSLVAGRIVDRFGSRGTTVATSVALSLLLPLIALAPVPAVLFAVLVVIGGLDGVTDVAQNTQAMQVQELRPTSIVTRMHAMWSIGTLSGGLIASRAAAAGIALSTQLFVTSLILAAVTLTAAGMLLPRAEAKRHEDGTLVARRPIGRPMAIGLFALGAVAILSEMPPTEWASLIMAERFDLDTGDAAFGFVAFAAGMVVGRLLGDSVVDRIGPESTRRGGGAVGAVGILVVAISPTAPVALVGFVVTALGVSLLFPMTVRRASELSDGSATGVAVFSSGARAGILLSSPLMGAISDATTRTIALVVIAGSATVASALVRLPDHPA